MNLLEVKNLAIEYKGGIKALNDLNFELMPGEILAVVGESGSGKSTLAHTLLDLLPLDCRKSGRILLNDIDILTQNEKKWQALRGKDISLVMQEPAASFNPLFTLDYQFREILFCKLGIKEKKQADEIIKQALIDVKLPQPESLIKSYPHQLSGGQLQRIAIAMAISVKPKILIADEPTSSLDVTSESQIVNLFKELNQKLGLAIIFITHNLDIVKILSSRALVLKKGILEEFGSTENIFKAPKSPYTKELLASLSQLE
jgi:ABC-type glutathione transport system ATPase component